MALKPSDINPLKSNFEDCIIPMHSLRLPYKQGHSHKQFKRCKFVGPGAVAILGGTFVRSGFITSGHILTLPDDVELTGITVFENCTVEDCEFIQVTILIPRAHAAQLARDIPGLPIAY